MKIQMSFVICSTFGKNTIVALKHFELSNTEFLATFDTMNTIGAQRVRHFTGRQSVARLGCLLRDCSV